MNPNWPLNMQQTNFGRNVTITPQHFYTPTSEDEVVEILNRHKGQRIRCVGRRHSWSNILASDDVLIDLRELNEVEHQLRDDSMTVRVGAGCQIKCLLAKLLRLKRWTLPSVGFITEQTVAGAIATGTHGSGRHSLSHYVISLRVARYDRRTGKAVIEEISTGDELRAARCSLGCVGVILTVTMQCRPTYSVEEHFQEYSNLSEVLDAEEEYPLQQFYLVPWRWTYFAQHRRETDPHKSKTLPLYHWYRFLVFDVAMHLLIMFVVRITRVHALIRASFRWLVPSCVIRNWRVTGPSSTQLVMEHELFRHVEIELFVKQTQLDSALRFLEDVLKSVENKIAILAGNFQAQLEEAQCTEKLSLLRGVYCHHYPICVRKILPDDTLISMASNATATASETFGDPERTNQGNDAWYSITLTNYHRGNSRKPFDDLAGFLSTSMARLFGARPHWGKLCPLRTEEICSLYPAFERFAKVCVQADPERSFSNRWTIELLNTTQRETPNKNLEQL